MLTHLSFPPSWSVFCCQNGASGSFLAPSLKVRNEKFKWFETGLATLFDFNPWNRLLLIPVMVVRLELMWAVLETHNHAPFRCCSVVRATAGWMSHKFQRDTTTTFKPDGVFFIPGILFQLCDFNHRWIQVWRGKSDFKLDCSHMNKMDELTLESYSNTHKTHIP